MLTKEFLQNQILRKYRGDTPILSVWTKNNGVTEQLLNIDGSEPHVRIVDPSREKFLALISDYQVESEVFKVTLVYDSTNEPSPNYSYYISYDAGTTLIPVQWVSKQIRTLGAFLWLYLMKQ